ncbi:MAG: aldehyde dehydrogenase family protein [Trueperaceae bacterium]|nr:aldehyde dehydrogenase family protein [Trueperaceae bacterium]
MREFGLYIDGEWTDALGGGTFEVIDPANGRPVARVARGGAQDVERAVRAATKAAAAWQAMPLRERAAAMRRVADLMQRDTEELALLETLDSGGTLWYSEVTVTDIAAKRFEYFAGLVDKVEGQQIPVSANHLVYTALEPLGVTAHIIPWNGPLWEASRSVPPALAAGNAVILKPAQEALLGAIKLGELAKEAGLPDGLVNVIPGPGSDVGEALVQHPGIHGITFTGSVATGQRIMRGAAATMKRLVLELGGNAANIVFDDADLERAVEGSVWAAFSNSGQICVSGPRILVHESVREEFTARFVERVKSLSVGPGVENHPIGPVVSEHHMRSVLDYIEVGKQEGAKLLTGGQRATDGALRDGYFVMPTVFDDVTPSMRIWREEIFGPVVTITGFRTEEEAVHMANDTEYGLANGMWTQSLARAHRVARLLQSGQVYVNEWFCGDIQCPAGGYKMSGIGREEGQQALGNYLQLKSVRVNLG